MFNYSSSCFKQHCMQLGGWGVLAQRRIFLSIHLYLCMHALSTTAACHDISSSSTLHTKNGRSANIFL